MNHCCPNSKCENYKTKESVVKDGSYFRKGDSSFVTRLKCSSCGKRFSNSTSTLEYRQKKRRENLPLLKLLCSGISMRRAGWLLNLHQITVARKLIYLAKKSRIDNSQFLENLKDNPVKNFQFDDLITSEHTKMKPISITVAVNKDNREILGLKVCQIPAFGLLAKKSVRKYGYRKSFHKLSLEKLFESIKETINPTAHVESDEHKTYLEIVKKYLPRVTHERYKGGRGAITGQGELKKLNYDPLFTVNHTCAMLRGNINRLIRKTWCTTKNSERLQDHLDIYMYFHNQLYLKR